MRTVDNRIVLLKSLVGSHNYNLNTETSDKDYKLFVVPTFDDLYSGKQHSSQVLTETEDYVVHDVRKLPEQLFKANINYMEVLASNQIYTASTEMNHLLYLKQEIFKMNLPQFYKACHGMFKTKMTLLGKGTEGTQHLVDAYGYDTKQAVHAYRSIRVPVDFEATGFNDFEASIKYSGEDLDFIMSIRNGEMTRDVFENFISHYYESTFLKMESKYITHDLNNDLYEELKLLVRMMVRKNLSI